MEKSSFIEVFGDSPEIRVLDFFLTFSEFDYPIKQVAKEIEAGWTTVENSVKALIKKGILKETREFGKAKLFALDKENNIAKALLKIDLELSFALAEKSAIKAIA